MHIVTAGCFAAASMLQQAAAAAAACAQRAELDLAGRKCSLGFLLLGSVQTARIQHLQAHYMARKR